MTENLKPTSKVIRILENKINFIIKKCGGDSLSHIFVKIEHDAPSSQGFSAHNSLYWKVEHGIEEKWDKFRWLLIKGGKEAKLQSQSDECINSLATILGYEDAK